MSALGHKRTFALHQPMSALPPIATAKADLKAVARLLRASAAFRWASVFCGVGDVIRTRITEAAIACQNIASAVAVFEWLVLAIPIHATCAELDHRTPWGLISLSRWTEEHTSKSSSGSSKDQAAHRSLHAYAGDNTERPIGIRRAMSAFPPKADICRSYDQLDFRVLLNRKAGGLVAFVC